MGLLDLQTDLKSYKFGVPPASDRPGGGNSGEPYIKKSIDRNTIPQSEDFLLRGGINAPLDAATDVARLAKFFSDLKSPRGALFVAKQNLLSRTGVATQASDIIDWKNAPLNEGVYTPLSTLAQAGIGFTGGHIPKQGAIPFMGVRTYTDAKFQVIGEPSGKGNRLVDLYQTKIEDFAVDPINILSYSGGPNSDLGIGKTNIKFASFDQRTGINSGKNFQTYQIGLKYNRFSLTSPPTGVANEWFEYTKNIDSVSFPDLTTDEGLTYKLDDQISVYNSKTLTPRSDINTYQIGLKNSNTDRDTLPTFYSPLTSKGVSTIFKNEFNPESIEIGLSDGNGGRFGRTFQTSVYNRFSVNDDSTFPLQSTDRIYDNGTLTWNQEKIEEQTSDNDSKNSTSTIKEDFRKPLLRDKKISTVTGVSPNYSDPNKRIDGTNGSRIRQSSPGQSGNRINYSKGKIIGGNDNGTGGRVSVVDRINFQPLYKSTNVRTDNDVDKNDLVKFRIAAVLRTKDNKPPEKIYTHFRAFINSFSDAYNASWSGIKYMGRGEEFYKYGGFGRKISLSFTVAAQSKPELMAQYKKLNFLASTLAPDYGDSGYMGGVLTTLTMGGWCFELPGFIGSLTLEVPQESPWELALPASEKDADTGNPIFSDKTVKEMPHICNVSMDFTPIHTFRPELQQNNYNENGNGEVADNGEDPGYGPQRFLQLTDAYNNNYVPVSLKDAQTPNSKQST